MARKLTLLVILTVSLLIIPLDVSSGVTDLSENEWGFQEGDQFNYTLRMYIPELDIDIRERITVRVLYLGELPETAESFTIQPFHHYYQYVMIWRNGTYLWETMRVPNAGNLWSAVPIGSWSTLHEVYGSDPEFIRTEESLGTWGFTYPHEYAEYAEILTCKYSKTNGVIQRYFNRISYMNGSVEYLAEITMDGYVSDLTVIGGIVGASTIILIIGIVARRRRVLPV